MYLSGVGWLRVRVLCPLRLIGASTASRRQPPVHNELPPASGSFLPANALAFGNSQSRRLCTGLIILTPHDCVARYAIRWSLVAAVVLRRTVKECAVIDYLGPVSFNRNHIGASGGAVVTYTAYTDT